MKGPIPQDKIEEVKNRADIVSVISEYVTLKKAGKNFLGLCPFHKEKTASFTVNSDKQIFYCFGCGEGGNVISFMMKAANLTFPEAVRALAEKTGVVIPRREMNREQKAALTKMEQIRKLNEKAAAFFVRDLFLETGSGARSYLRDRGIGDEAVRVFRIGYAPEGWRHLRDLLEREKIPLGLAEQAGLIVQKTGDAPGGYDRFRQRLIFPIEDAGGQVIAFGGRLIGSGEPKYLNSPESPLYVKGRNLYGLSKTKEEIRRSGCAILVEGYFDLISLWNAGIKNVVATLGTALTREQVRLIRRYTLQVVASFDPDEAGRKALVRCLELLLSENVEGKVLMLPEGYDPDDYVRTFGKESFLDRVNDALPMVDYYIDHFIGGNQSLQKDRDTLTAAIALLSRIEDALQRNLFVKRISETLGVDQDLLKREINLMLATGMKPAGEAIRGQNERKIDPVELFLVQLLIEHPEKIPRMVTENVMDYMEDPDLKTMGRMLVERYDIKEFSVPDATALIEGLENERIRTQLLRSLVESPPLDHSVADRVFDDTVHKVKRKWYRQQHGIIRRKLVAAQRSGDQTLCHSLILEKDKLLREERALQSGQGLNE
ncbi:MAG: DNA primase [Deltaproteobacteria bacterium]|nr:DNA primase [Deltaproteobacteria bacterium]